MRLSILIPIASLGASLACAETRPPPPLSSLWVQQSLPGFSLMLPAGDVQKNKSEHYALGSFNYGKRGVYAIHIAWRPGPMAATRRAHYEKAWSLERESSSTSPTPGGMAEVFVGRNKAPARVTFYECGDRSIVIASVAHKSVDALHGTVLSRFECSPDASLESSARLRLDLRDRTGWVRAGTANDLLTLFKDGGRTSITAMFYLTKPSPREMRRVALPSKLVPGGLSPIDNPERGARGWLRLLKCDSHWALIIYAEMALGPASTDIVEGVRCLGPDEDDIEWPPAGPTLQRLLADEPRGPA